MTLGRIALVATDGTPPAQWPLLSASQQAALPRSARSRLSLFLRHALLDHLRNHPEQFAHPARFDANITGEPTWTYGGLTSEEQVAYKKINTARRWVCCQVFDGTSCAASISLANGLVDHTIEPQPPLTSVDPLSETMSGVSVIAVVTDRQGNSGFMSPRGVLTQSVSNAALYPDLVAAQRSIKGYGSGRRGVQSDSAVYFQAEVRLVGVAPDSSIKEGRPNELASGILCLMDRAALEAVEGAPPDAIDSVARPRMRRL